MINRNVLGSADRRILIGYALTGTTLLFLYLIGISLPVEERNFWFKEGRLIESATVFGYFLCTVFIVYKGQFAHLKHLFTLIVFFLLRELDFDKRFTTMGIFKGKFLFSASVPPVEKLAGAMVILAVLYVFITILRRYSKLFFQGLKNRSVISQGILIIIVFLVASKSLDGISRRLRLVGIEMSKQASMHAGVVEEILELGIPIVIYISLNACFNAAKHTSPSEQPEAGSTPPR